MYKILIPLALVVLSACVPVAVPVGGGGYGGPAVQQPDIYDLPAHCYYASNGQILCSN